MSEVSWFIDGEGRPVEADDDDTYDEAYGPEDPQAGEGRLVEDDEGSHPDVTSEAVATMVGDRRWKSAEEAAIHVVDGFGLASEELVDLDELPEDPDER